VPNVLQSYLIKLGFAIDDNGWKGFQSRIAQSGKNIAELGAVSVATALEIGVAVERVARHYENLYYVSQRAGSTVSSLKAQQFGFTQIGLSADQARSAVEGFAGAVRMNPGVRAMFRGMGIDTADASKAIGQLVDRTKAQFGEQGYFVAARIAAMGGMDEGAFKQMWDNRDRLRAEEEASIERQKRMGINVDDAARRFTEYGRKLNTVGDNFGLLKDRIALDFLPAANKTLDWVELGITKFGEFNVTTGGLAGQFATLAIAAGGVKAALVPIMALLRALGIVGAASAGGGVLGALRGRLLRGGAIAGALGLAGAIKHDSQTGNTMRTKLRAMLGIEDPGEAAPWRGAVANNANSAVDFYMSKGWTREQAAGIAANLHAESGLNPRSVGDGGQAYGLAQWHPDRQANFARWAGHSIKDSTLQEQMEFVHYEMTQGKEKLAGNALRNARTAREAGSVVSKMYERPGDVEGQAALRGSAADALLVSGSGSGGATISQKTEVNIHGVSDPHRAADLATDAQKRVNGDLTRNTASLFH
jgi:hypothetical protein